MYTQITQCHLNLFLNCSECQVCLVINSAMGAGLSWEDIGAMVATETAAGIMS